MRPLGTIADGTCIAGNRVVRWLARLVEVLFLRGDGGVRYWMIPLVYLIMVIMLFFKIFRDERDIFYSNSDILVSPTIINIDRSNTQDVPNIQVDFSAIPEPPILAELLLGLFAKNEKYRSSISDSLEEMFEADILKGMTVKRARRRYWITTLRSILPQLKQALIRGARWSFKWLQRLGFIAILASALKNMFH